MNPPKGIDPTVWEMALDVAEPINPGTILYGIIAEAAAKAISRAIEAEREECAKIAYTTPHYTIGSGFGDLDARGQLKPGSPYDAGRYDASQSIRNRSNTTTERNEG